MLLSQINGISPRTRKFTPSNVFTIPDGVVGVEVETEWNLFDPPQLLPEFWEGEEDGSLRNGWEYKTRPLFGSDLEFALHHLEDTLSQNSNWFLSHRCGLHIHLDVTSFSTGNLLSLACIVALAEQGLYNYVGEERRNNIYCLPISQTDNILPYLNSIKYGESTNDVYQAIKATQKYSGFNILPILDQGSVEFRFHAGEVKTEEIIKWINILQRFILLAQEYDAVELLDIPFTELPVLLFEDMAEEIGQYDYLTGWMVAKDILNFNKLTDVWDEIRDGYNEESRLPMKRLDLNLTKGDLF